MAEDTKPRSATAQAKADAALPALGPLGMIRWAWTQLTSMRTALFLLLLLAVAAVPGSLFPQRGVNPEQVTQYLQNEPVLGEWLDRFQLFDVYSSVWFSSIYLLLFISLIGCIIPRAKKHWQALRTPPPRTPARLSRLPEHGRIALAPGAAPASSSETAARAAALLKKRGYRTEVRDGAQGASVGAERGYVREIGNLVFHTSLIGILAGVAVGGAFGYNGQRILVEGDTFVNTAVAYDALSPGTAVDVDRLSPFTVALDKFEVTFDRESSTHFGQPIDFNASVRTTDTPGGEETPRQIRVNHPLRIGGSDVYLVGNGYAPVITVRDGNGDIALQEPVIAVPQDGVYTSLMVAKVPDARPEQLGFVGLFLPTAGVLDGVGISLDPSPALPQLQLNSYFGDLGLDDGAPQNVYVLDTDELTELNSRTLDAGGLVLNPGETIELPDGHGSISFDGLKRYVALDIHHDPAKVPVAVFAALALLGLAVSLFTPRRRAWVKILEDGGEGDGGDGGSGEHGRILEYGLLARGEDPRLATEARELQSLFEREFTGAERVPV
ncbi:cytochrome c biogenesis protein ResB [Zafaria sp. Z1313]|uniref:cytochrome c biogenesis protein ResB n=1 Tax=unclassified Zafaria TaxID=2828765 RepID=UPI002E77A0F9|nr:cytochrome c biogenesis protein ResB [Zafaria sp. J156]MEE1621317.1 cytochrome c biogenesis protein ResB [Zafaria sp. J156]